MRLSRVFSWRRPPGRPNFRPRLEALEDRALPSSLTLITNGTQFPYSAVVHIDVVFPNTPAGQYWEGTGVLIDAFHVLTAGHVVYDAAQGGYASKVEVYAGQTGTTTPFGVAYATNERTFSSFISDDSINSNTHSPGDGDIGLITLDRPLGNQTGWLSIGETTNSSFFSGQTFSKIGYPASNGYSGTDMYAESGQLIGAISGTSSSYAALEWSTAQMTSISGESGSGLFYTDSSGNRTVYGVLDLGNGAYGYAEEITPTVYSTLEGWIAQDAVPTNPVATTTSLSASATALTYGQSVTFTATVTATSGAPTGTVQFFDGSTLLGSGTLSSNNGVEQATFSTSSLGTGSHSITAVYQGTSGFSQSTSTAVIITVSAGSQHPAGLPSFVIGQSGTLWECDPNGVWHQIGAANSTLSLSVGVDLRGRPVVYIVAQDHSIWEDHAGYYGATNWIQLSGPGTALQVVAGVDDLCFAIASDHSVWENDTNGIWHELSGTPCTSIAAGTDFYGRPVVYAVTTDGSLWEDAAGASGLVSWTQLAGSGSVKSVQGGYGNFCYVLSPNGSVWEKNGSQPWQILAGAGSALAISAGTDAVGNNVIYAIASNRSTWLNDSAGGGWSGLSGSNTAVVIDGSAGGGWLTTIHPDGSVWANDGAGNWYELAGPGNAATTGYAGGIS
jgi:V8-like Glu-specific endopeptidase